MNESLALPDHRFLRPVAVVLMVIAFAATLALGFGLRAWTEPTSATSSPGPALSQVHDSEWAAPARMGKPW